MLPWHPRHPAAAPGRRQRPCRFPLLQPYRPASERMPAPQCLPGRERWLLQWQRVQPGGGRVSSYSCGSDRGGGGCSLTANRYARTSQPAACFREVRRSCRSRCEVPRTHDDAGHARGRRSEHRRNRCAGACQHLSRHFGLLRAPPALASVRPGARCVGRTPAPPSPASTPVRARTASTFAPSTTPYALTTPPSSGAESAPTSSSFRESVPLMTAASGMTASTRRSSQRRP